MRLTQDELILLANEDRNHYMAMLPDDQEVFAKQWRSALENSRPAAHSYASNDAYAPKSKMLGLGRFGFIFCVVLTAFTTFKAITDYSPEFLWPFIWGSLTGLFCMMWMLGAIEQRLLDIRQELRAR